MTAQRWGLWLTCTIWISPGREERTAVGLSSVEILPGDLKPRHWLRPFVALAYASLALNLKKKTTTLLWVVLFF